MVEQGQKIRRTEPVRRDIEALKQGQETLRKDMDNIKKLLGENDGEQSVARAFDNVLEIGGSLCINGTPTLMLGVSNGDKVVDVRVIQGAHPFPLFKQEIDKLLNGNEQRAENK